jgi:hypothetical protein
LVPQFRAYGFTGTSLWIDPGTEIRRHLDQPTASRWRAAPAARFEVATLAAAIADAPPRPIPTPTPPPSPPTVPSRLHAVAEGLHPVHCGIDILVEEGFASCAKGQ